MGWIDSAGVEWACRAVEGRRRREGGERKKRREVWIEEEKGEEEEEEEEKKEEKKEEEGSKILLGHFVDSTDGTLLHSTMLFLPAHHFFVCLLFVV